MKKNNPPKTLDQPTKPISSTFPTKTTAFPLSFERFTRKADSVANKTCFSKRSMAEVHLRGVSMVSAACRATANGLKKGKVQPQLMHASFKEAIKSVELVTNL